MIFPLEVTEQIFITLLTGTENYKLCILGTDLLDHIIDQVKALLICQSGNNTDHKCLVILIQSQLLLKTSLILDLLLTECLCIVICVDQRICLRIVLIIIKTVYNTTQAVAAGTHQTVQMLAVKWHLDLLCIGITDCRYHVSIYDTTLEIIGISICLQLITGEIVLIQSCDVDHLLLIPDTLELQIMYGHNSLDTMVE